MKRVNIQLGDETHTKAKVIAVLKDMTLNEYLDKAIRDAIEKDQTISAPAHGLPASMIAPIAAPVAPPRMPPFVVSVMLARPPPLLAQPATAKAIRTATAVVLTMYRLIFFNSF